MLDGDFRIGGAFAGGRPGNPPNAGSDPRAAAGGTGGGAPAEVADMNAGGGGGPPDATKYKKKERERKLTFFLRDNRGTGIDQRTAGNIGRGGAPAEAVEKVVAKT